MHIVIVSSIVWLNYLTLLTIQHVRYARPCVLLCRLWVVLKRTGWISEVALKRVGLLQQVLKMTFLCLYTCW